MIRYYSSASRQGFFPSDVFQAKDLPEDAEEITFEQYQEILDKQSKGKMIDWTTNPPCLRDREVVWPTTKELAAKIDARVAEVYATWARFEPEYTLREKAAQAYKNSGYEGDPGNWVSSFAQAADLSSKVAANRILEQAATLRQAQEDIGALRMRKFQLADLDDEPRSELYMQLVAEIDAIAAYADEGEQGVLV
ncbi:hypothetical protein ACIPZ5_14605 [Pseudomonas sp. NPDC089428]|uniref:hypothetical protein n=1 Tax=Pseudomonas sp. NPDC089428 TaxID=3364467 RepID=UPI003825FFA9